MLYNVHVYQPCCASFDENQESIMLISFESAMSIYQSVMLISQSVMPVSLFNSVFPVDDPSFVGLGVFDLE